MSVGRKRRTAAYVPRWRARNGDTDRSAESTPDLALTRRQLLKAAGVAFVAWQAAPWPIRAPSSFAQVAGDPAIVPTLEAFADTLIPGAKRTPDDRAIAGAAPGAGGVEAGAVTLMNFPPSGIAPALPTMAADLNRRAEAYALAHAIVLDPTVPALVALDFAARTAVCLETLDAETPDQLAYYALAALVFLAYHTAAHLHTPQAVRDGHPGLAALGFPLPDADDLWRYPVFSYGRKLARGHRRARRNSPA
jgi:enediyne biosynthesis protein E8